MNFVDVNPPKSETITHGKRELGFFIRPTTWHDLDRVAELAGQFFIESNFSRSGLTVNLEAYKQTIKNYWRNPYVTSFIAIEEETSDILGYVHIYAQRDYTVELVGEMYQFYVIPRARGTHVSRALVAAACEQYDAWGCARSYCEASPGMPDEKHLMTFRNLWGKFGFNQVGITLMREANYGKQSTSTSDSATSSAAASAGE